LGCFGGAADKNEEKNDEKERRELGEMTTPRQIGPGGNLQPPNKDFGKEATSKLVRFNARTGGGGRGTCGKGQEDATEAGEEFRRGGVRKLGRGRAENTTLRNRGEQKIREKRRQGRAGLVTYAETS